MVADVQDIKRKYLHDTIGDEIGDAEVLQDIFFLIYKIEFLEECALKESEKMKRLRKRLKEKGINETETLGTSAEVR